MDSAYSPHSITYRRTSSFGFQTRLHSRGNAPSPFLSASSTIAHKQTYLFIYIQYVDCHPPGKVLSLHTSAGKRSCTDHHHLVRDLEKAVQYTDPVIPDIEPNVILFNCDTLALDSEFLSQAGGSRCVHIYYSTLVCVKRASPSTR